MSSCPPVFAISETSALHFLSDRWGEPPATQSPGIRDFMAENGLDSPDVENMIDDNLSVFQDEMGFLVGNPDAIAGIPDRLAFLLEFEVSDHLIPSGDISDRDFSSSWKRLFMLFSRKLQGVSDVIQKHGLRSRVLADFQGFYGLSISVLLVREDVGHYTELIKALRSGWSGENLTAHACLSESKNLSWEIEAGMTPDAFPGKSITVQNRGS